MKKILVFVLFALLTVACQQKEEPKPQFQFPSGAGPGPIQSQEDEKLLRDAVVKDPKNVNAWIKLGNVMMDSARPNEAIEAYQKALDIDPRNVNVRVDLGTCYRNAGKPDLAVKEYRKALEMDPKHPNGHRNLGVVLGADLGDKAQALKELETYLQLVPNAPDKDVVLQEMQKYKTAR